MSRFYVLTQSTSFYISLDLKAVNEIGGEANVYVVKTQVFGLCAIKLYRDLTKAQRLREKVLYLMRQEPPYSGKNILLCWPIGAVYDNTKSKFLGYVMPCAFDDSRDLSILSAYSTNSTIADMFPEDVNWHHKYELLTQRGLRNRCAILYNWASAIWILHRTGKYILGDIKPENIMVEPNFGRISVIDIDSCQVTTPQGKLLFARTAQTPNHRPPECNSSISKVPIDYRYDSFSFAVSAYIILTGTHPFTNVRLKAPYFGNPQYNTIANRIRNGLYIRGPKAKFMERISQCDLHSNLNKLPIYLQELFDNSFIENRMRPSMEHWKVALHKTIDKLKV